jgi:acyl-CoA thioesterase
MTIGPEGVPDMMARHNTPVSEGRRNTFSGYSTKSTGSAPDTDCKWNTIFGYMVLAVALLTSKHTVGELLTIGKLN